MEELVIFRIFLTFPLVGLLIPKAGIIFAGGKGYISAADVIIAITLIVSIITCSIGILHHKKKITVIKSNEPAISWDI